MKEWRESGSWMGLRSKIRWTLSLFLLLGISRQCEDEDGMALLTWDGSAVGEGAKE